MLWTYSGGHIVFINEKQDHKSFDKYATLRYNIGETSKPIGDKIMSNTIETNSITPEAIEAGQRAVYEKSIQDAEEWAQNYNPADYGPTSYLYDL